MDIVGRRREKGGRIRARKGGLKPPAASPAGLARGTVRPAIIVSATC